MKFGVVFPVAAILLSSFSMALAEGEERANEPSAADQAEAEKQVKNVYREDYAKRGPEERRNLAEKLLEDGRITTKDLAMRYVLMREARDLMISLGEVERTIEVVEEIVRSFNVDAVEMRLSALTGLKAAVHSAEANASAATSCILLLDLANKADNIEAASKAVDLAVAFAAAGKNVPQIAEIQLRKTDIKAQMAAYLEMKAAQEKLKADPKDAAAKFTVGSYLCIYKNDWDKGLTIVAEGSDAGWSAAAKADIANPVDVTGMVKVADLWWDLAQKAALTKPRILVRSEFWYRLTLPIAEGIVKTRIEKRLEVIDSTKIDPAGLAVSEATRKILPTAADLDRLKLLAAGAQTNTEKHQEMTKMLAEFDEHLRADLYGLKESDYFARVKADLAIRKVITQSGMAKVLANYSGPLWATMTPYWVAAKTKEELARRLIASEKFNAAEKVFEKSQFDVNVDSAVRTFVNSNQRFYPAAKDKVALCYYLKNQGVASPGVDKVRACYLGIKAP